MFDLFAGARGGDQVRKQPNGAKLLKVMMGTKKTEEKAHRIEALKVARVARRQKRQEEDKQEDIRQLSDNSATNSQDDLQYM